MIVCAIRVVVCVSLCCVTDCVSCVCVCWVVRLVARSCVFVCGCLCEMWLFVCLICCGV